MTDSVELKSVSTILGTFSSSPSVKLINSAQSLNSNNQQILTSRSEQTNQNNDDDTKSNGESVELKNSIQNINNLVE